MEEFDFEFGPDFAKQMDGQDELASFREEFVFPEPEMIYLDGNSLGRLPRRTVDRVSRACLLYTSPSPRDRS